jgi:ribosome-associated protein
MKKQRGEVPGARSRPPMKTSHERVFEGATRKSRTKTPRRATRAQTHGALRGERLAAALRTDGSSLKARSPTKARVRAEAERDVTGAWSVASDAARERATAIAVAALDKKAVGVEILDVAGRVDYADFLVIMSGRSDRHAQALAQGIEEALKIKGVQPIAVEGLPYGTWVLLDFGDVVVHVFQDEARQLYDIEGLWLDARRLPVPGPLPTD